MAKVKMGRWELDTKELDRQHEEAINRGKERMKTEQRAESAYYDSERKRIVVELTNGCTFMFPPELLQGLRGAAVEDLADVKVMPGGFALGWNRLDVHFSIAGLIAGEFGNKKWMAELKKSKTLAFKNKPTSIRNSSKNSNKSAESFNPFELFAPQIEEVIAARQDEPHELEAFIVWVGLKAIQAQGVNYTPPQWPAIWKRKERQSA